MPKARMKLGLFAVRARFRRRKFYVRARIFRIAGLGLYMLVPFFSETPALNPVNLPYLKLPTLKIQPAGWILLVLPA